MDNDRAFYFFEKADVDNGNYVIGSEYCIHLAIDSIKNFRLSSCMADNIRVVTPLVPDVYVNVLNKEICDLVEKFADVKVVFNDLGFFHRCQELINLEKITPIFGRILLRSFMDCPWNSEILKGEKEEIQHKLKSHIYDDRFQLELLKRYGINEVEINPKLVDLIGPFKSNSVKVCTYVNNNLLAISRNCYYAKLYGIDVSVCCESANGGCSEKIFVKQLKKYSRPKFIYSDVICDFWNQDNRVYALGNSIYSVEDSFDDNNAKEVDYYVFSG